jgi:CHAT domain-containing protein
LRQEGRQLYDWIIGPFADFLFAANPKQRLVVELDGVLAAIPIQALMDRDGAYLGDQFLVLSSVGYATTPLRSGSLDRSARALAIVNPTILGAGASEFPTLPDSLDEARAVQATFPASIVVAGQQATVEALIATLPSVEIVHFSGHGYTNAESGALLFSPADPKKSDYDALRSIEVSRQDWSRVRLVVLSACAAAAGETRGPHNPESLVRALTKAGAPQVAASLWNVDSGPTLKLMNGFYAALGQGQSPAQALRTAQQSLRQRAAWAHPHYWAGFQLYGTT